ncbi:MAG: AAA family ATPase [Burkholderiaceae bacterium]
MMKATVIAKEHDRLGELDAIMRKAGPGMEIESVIGGANLLGEEIGRQGTSLVVADAGAISATERENVELALSSRADVALILLSDDQSSEFLMWAMRSGVAEVVPASCEPIDLLKAVLRQIKRKGSDQARFGASHKASVIAFLPAKGGSGATFLATNVASALAARGKRVALIDLNLHMGEAALYLCDEQPTKSIADIAVDAERVDESLLQSAMVPVDENIWLLPAPDTPEAGMEVDAVAVTRIIEIARQNYDFVVIDTGRVLDARSIAGLDAADTIHLVMQLALPYVHDAKRLKRVFDGLGYPAEKLRLVVNRYERGTDVTIRDVEKALLSTVATKIPNDFKTVTYAINHALPIVKYKKRNPVSEAIFDLVNQISPEIKRRGVFGAIGLRTATAARG